MTSLRLWLFESFNFWYNLVIPEEEQPKANGHTKTNMKSESYWVNGPQKVSVPRWNLLGACSENQPLGFQGASPILAVDSQEDMASVGHKKREKDWSNIGATKNMRKKFVCIVSYGMYIIRKCTCICVFEYMYKYCLHTSMYVCVYLCTSMQIRLTLVVSPLAQPFQLLQDVVHQRGLGNSNP